MSEKREHNFCQTFLRTKGILVSTGYRQSSAAINDPPWYFETIAWKGLGEGEMIFMESSGRDEKLALERHQEICRKLFTGEPIEERDAP